jgi:hypothetical protein
MATMSATIPVTKTASNIAKKWFSRRSLIPIKDHWIKNDKRDYKEDFNNDTSSAQQREIRSLKNQ